MGYRSEVGILITLPKRVKSETIISKLFSKWDKKDLKQVFQIKTFEEYGIKYVYAHADWLKWYDETFEDEKATMNFIHRFKDNYKTGGVHFIRIGESYDDTEEIVVGEPAKFLGLERYLTL